MGSVMQVQTPPLLLDDQHANAHHAPLRNAAFAPRHPPANTNHPSVFIEEIDDRSVASIDLQWRLLEARAIEPNPYFTPEFLTAAMRHFRTASAPRLLAVWHSAVPPYPPRLIGLIPLGWPAAGLRRGLLHSWHHPFTALGTPVLDRDHAQEALTAALAHLREKFGDSAAILFDSVPEHGPLADVLRRHAAEQGSGLSVLARRQRAVLTANTRTFSGSRRNAKELARLHRRLAGKGHLTFRIVTGYAEIRSATEDFLALEAAGWKGRAGTAIVQDPDSANFTRAMVWAASRRGKVRIARLDLEGRMIAAVILLQDQTTAVLWKTTYDEALARYAPGVLLFEKVGAHLAADPSITLTDSCAGEGHAMIESLWKERMTVCDVMLGLSPAGRHALPIRVGQEKLARTLRAQAGRLYHSLVG